MEGTFKTELFWYLIDKEPDLLKGFLLHGKENTLGTLAGSIRE